jgi:hypothetical protein
MYLRKQYEGVKTNHKLSEEAEIDHENIKYKDNLPYDIFGLGSGLESTHPLQFWLDKKHEAETDEWEEVDSDNTDKNKNEKKNLFDHSDDEEDDSDEDEMEDFFAEFFEENTKELKSGKFSCKFCDNKKLSYDAMKKHFIKTHQKEYESSPYVKSAPWKKAIEINKKIEEKFEEDFMEEMMGGGEDMGFDFGFGGGFGKEPSAKENKKMMKDLEKMMMGMFMGPGMGMPGGNTRKKKK